MNNEILTTPTEPLSRTWERFAIGHGNPRQRHLRVSINKRGNIQLNPAAMKRLDHPRALALYFDRANLSIGLAACQPNEPDAFRITIHPTRGYGRIAALSFFRHHRFNIRSTLVTDFLEVNDGILILDLEHLRPLPRSKILASPP